MLFLKMNHPEIASIKFDLENSDITYYKNFINKKFSIELFDYFNNLQEWKTNEIKIFGKKCLQNRETLCFSYNNLDYKYSGLNNIGIDITEHTILIKLKNEIEKIFSNKYTFNYVLANRYKDGSNNIGMHSDNEKDLQGPIVCISLGSSRFFDFKGIYNNLKKRIILENGSMLVMKGTTQKYYKHGIPLQKKINDSRISLTFRIII